MSSHNRSTFAHVMEELYDQGRSGILQVVGPSGEVTIHLQEGNVAHLETPDESSWQLSRFLAESGWVTQKQYEKATKQAVRDGQSVEHVLVKRRLITDDSLKKLLEVFIQETLLSFFGETSLKCTFSATQPKSNQWTAPISVPFLIKESRDRINQWPAISRSVPNGAMVFDKNPSAVSSMLGDLNVANRPGSSDAAPSMGGDARIVFYFLNGKKTAQQVAYASFLGEFRTYRALSQLVEAGHITLIASEGSGERLRTKQFFLPLLLGFIAYAAAGALVFALGAYHPGVLATPSSLFAPLSPELKTQLQDHHLIRVESALERYRLIHMRYPDSLNDLVDAKLLTSHDFDVAHWDIDRRYRLMGDSANAYQWKFP